MGEEASCAPIAGNGVLVPLPATSAPPATNASGSRSLVQSIRNEFHSIAGSTVESDATITADDLARHWEGLALAELRLRGRCMLGSQSKQAIALRVAQLMQDMDLMRRGGIGIEEWVHFMLLARSGIAVRQVNALLDKAIEKNKTILQDLQRMFDAADTTRCGTLSFTEIVSMYSRKLWHLRPCSNGPSKNMSDEELRAGDPEEFALEVVQAMDINGDERVSYPEFMAYSLGRRKHEVLLHLYDLSNGAAESISPWLIGQKLEGVWHTGVVVYGKEYYYSKDTVYADAGDTSFGKPTRIVHLGYTLWRQDELHEFVTTELKPVFQRDTYDVVCNNCNHFSDRVCMYLVGKHPPPEVLRQPELLLQARSIRWLRPVLNWWLRDRIVVREKGVALPPGIQRLKAGDQLALGTVVTIHAARHNGPTILGQVTTPEGRDPDGNTEGVCGTGAAVLAPSVSNMVNGATSGGFETAGCSGLWNGTCGIVRASTASAVGGGTTTDGIWVQYFDLPLPGSNCSRAQVRTEIIPHNRLSLGGLQDPYGEAALRQAVRAFVVPSDPASPRRTGRGAAPHRVPVPSAMSDGKEPKIAAMMPGAAVSQL